LTRELLLNDHTDPVESLENTNDFPADGLVVEKVVPHGFMNAVPFVIL